MAKLEENSGKIENYKNLTNSLSINDTKTMMIYTRESAQGRIDDLVKRIREEENARKEAKAKEEAAKAIDIILGREQKEVDNWVNEEKKNTEENKDDIEIE